MKLKSSKTINSSVEAIWEILRDPGDMPLWNPKCYSSSGNSNITVGSHFEATFKLSSQKAGKTTDCEVIELQPCEKITIRYSGGGFPSNGFVDETFYIVSKGPQRTKLKHEVDYTNSGLPFYVKLLMWIINTLGSPAGRSSLDGIEDLL